MKRILSFVLCVVIIISFTTIVTAETTEYSLLSSEHIRILGRGEVKDNTRTFNWPNAGFEFEFSGTTAKVYADESTPDNSTYNGNYFTMAVYDSDILIRAERIKLVQGWNTIYTYQSGDPDVKKIMLVRSSEARHSTIRMSKIQTDAVPVASKSREKRIEFIGDSYTVGYGNSPALSTSSGCNSQNTDNWNSYSGIVARHYNADNTVIAYSGKGLYANRDINALDYSMAKQFNLSDIYTDTNTSVNMSTEAEHNFQDYQPQLVTIWLGTNDITAQVPDETFKQKYIEFLENVRSKYPDAVILCMAKPQSNRYYDEIYEIVNDESRGALNKYYFHSVDSFSGSGIDTHPNIEENQAIAAELIETIDSMPWVWETMQEDDTTSLSIRADYNTGEVKVFGNIGSADTLVSAVVLKSEITFSDYGKEDIKYLNQTASTQAGDYKFTFEVDKIQGDYTFYMNMDTTKKLNQKSFCFKNLIPTMLVEKENEKVTEMQELNAGDELKITLSGFKTENDFKGILIVGYFEGNKLLSSEIFDASTDSQAYGTEIIKETNVVEKADKIKIFYFNQATLTPLIGEYTIE